MRHLLKIGPLILLYFAVVLLVYRFGNKDLLLVVLSFTIITPVGYLVMDRFVQKNQLLLLREEALRAELALLKKQINPHFFFNTLNNLYSLAVTKSEQAPVLILKLSDLMRFTIYEGRKDHVFLRDELAYLNNYLDIQRIRARLEKVDLSFEREVDDDLVEVPPLMLIMLVENAVKHGVDTLTENAFIHIKLRLANQVLDFSIANNYEANEATEPGIGLTNLKRRLNLCFPGRYLFETTDEAGVYTAHLRLHL